jgi:hypothetical protein
VSASERSVPGDFLYPVKIAGEQTRLALTQGKADRVRLKAEFVDRRVEEIKTIVNTPEKKTSDRLRDAALGLKRDLDTVKNQLKEVKQEASAPVTAELAKLVDRTTEQVSQELKQVKSEVLQQEAKQAVVEAEAQAVQTSVAAVAVLIEANKTAPSDQTLINDEEVAKVLEGKIEGLRSSIEGSAERLMAANASGTLSAQTPPNTLSMTTTTTPELASASATLSEAKALLSENKLDEATTKLAEAAKATVLAVAAVDQIVASSTTMTATASETSPTSTNAGTGSSTSKGETVSSTGATPP